MYHRYTDELHDPVVTHVKTVFDKSDNYLAAEILSILDHQYKGGILEMKVEYSNGEMCWHPIDLVKDEDPQATA